MNLPRQCVVVASTWTSSLNLLLSKYTHNSTTIIASALEAAVRAEVELVSKLRTSKVHSYSCFLHQTVHKVCRLVL